MSNKIYREIEKINEIEGTHGVLLPKPYYLYVQKYGREIADDMDSIAKIAGKKEWFRFKVGGHVEADSIVNEFHMELKKHASVGKAYRDSVLIEFFENVREQELKEFIRVLKQEEGNYYYLFSVQKEQDEESVEALLEQYFFIRTVDAEAYTWEEQFDIFEKTIEQYDFSMTRDAAARMKNYFIEKEWHEEDAVAQKIENMAKTLVYDRLQEESSKYKIGVKQVENMLEQEKERQPERRMIGFQLGGYGYE